MKNKILTAGILVVVVIYLIITAYSGRNDFDIYTDASMALFNRKDIYSLTYIDGYHYYYSVIFALFIYPLSYLPIPLAKFIWLALNAFFLYRIVKIIAGYVDLNSFSVKKKLWFFALCFAFGLEFILLNFRYGQATILILYLSLEGLQFIFSGKEPVGALLIALGINIKILPVVFLPYLLYRKKIKAFALVVVLYCVLMALPGLVIGFYHNDELLVSWWHSINPMNKDHILDVGERSFHSLSTLLATLLVAHVPDPKALPIRRNIMDISPENLTYVLNTVRLVLISFSIWFFRTYPFTNAKNTLHRFWEISYLLLLIPLIFPHQQEYAFLFVTPAACYIIYYLLVEKSNIPVAKYRLLAVGCGLSYFACNCSLLLGQYNRYYEHFKVLTYGALLLIPMLAWCRPPALKRVKIAAQKVKV